jgi:hypothetical protein
MSNLRDVIKALHESGAVPWEPDRQEARTHNREVLMWTVIGLIAWGLIGWWCYSIS